MATARVSHKRSYDDFMAPYGDYGYNAHAGRNVQTLRAEPMDTMEEVMPSNKRSKFILSDDTDIISQPSTQATLIARAAQTLPKLSSPEDCTSPRYGPRMQRPAIPAPPVGSFLALLIIFSLKPNQHGPIHQQLEEPSCLGYDRASLRPGFFLEEDLSLSAFLSL
jgi:hypothetical protein